MSGKKDIRISEIIEAAIGEFIEKGYENSSMESIASRANLSKGGLYHHFKSKVEILFAVNLKLLEPIGELITKVEASKSVAGGLRRFILDYLSFWNDHRRELTLYFLTMNESFGNQQIMNLYSESTKQNFNFFEAQFIKGQQQGVFTKMNARLRAIGLLSCLDGFLGYLIIDPSISIKSMAKEIQDIFINDLLQK